MKEDFDDILENKDQEIRNIAFENQRICEELKEKKELLRSSHNAIEEHVKLVEELRDEL